VRQNACRVAPKDFCCFLSNRLEFYFEILQISLLNCFTSNCQVMFDSGGKRQRYGLFNVTTYQFSSVKNVQAATPIQ